MERHNLFGHAHHKKLLHYLLVPILSLQIMTVLGCKGPQGPRGSRGPDGIVNPSKLMSFSCLAIAFDDSTISTGSAVYDCTACTNASFDVFSSANCEAPPQVHYDLTMGPSCNIGVLLSLSIASGNMSI